MYHHKHVVMRCTILTFVSIISFKFNSVETLKVPENGIELVTTTERPLQPEIYCVKKKVNTAKEATSILERPKELEKFRIEEKEAASNTERPEPEKNHIPENKEATIEKPTEPEKKIIPKNLVETDKEATKEKPLEKEKEETKVETVKEATTERPLEPKIDCVVKKCIAKCCPNGLNVADHKTCEKPAHENLPFNIPLYDVFQKRTGKQLLDVYNLVPGRFVDGNFTVNDANDYHPVGHNYYLTENGILYEEVPNELKRWHVVNPDNYCVDFLLRNNKSDLRFWTIISTYTPSSNDPFLTSGLLISCIFLVAVLVVYYLLPELRNLNGLIQMAYVVSQLGAFLLLIVMRIMQHSIFTCLGLTYLIYFFFLATFCWINVMSWDINSTFGRSQLNHRWRRSNWSKFYLYCAYAFGLPSAMTIMLIVINHTDMRHLPWFVTPNLIKRGCFLGAEAKLLYLYIPMMILILFNFAMYIMTCNHLCQQYKNTAFLDSSTARSAATHRTQRKKFMIFVKLFSIMGLNWSLEVISSFFPGHYLWYISDLFNMLVGFLIFLITVGTQKSTRNKLIKRLQRRAEWSHFRFSRSRTSNSSSTNETDVTQEIPLRRPSVCGNPSGPS